MSKAQHTPGPWAYREPKYDSFQGLAESQANDPKKYRINAIDIYVAKGSGKGSEICRIVHDPEDGFDLIGDREEHEANARLIAAAPELLEALELTASNLGSLIAAQHHDKVLMTPWLDVINSAIAKAKGEA